MSCLDYSDFHVCCLREANSYIRVSECVCLCLCVCVTITYEGKQTVSFFYVSFPTIIVILHENLISVEYELSHVLFTF